MNDYNTLTMWGYSNFSNTCRKMFTKEDFTESYIINCYMLGFKPLSLKYLGSNLINTSISVKKLAQQELHSVSRCTNSARMCKKNLLSQILVDTALLFCICTNIKCQDTFSGLVQCMKIDQSPLAALQHSPQTCPEPH